MNPDHLNGYSEAPISEPDLECIICNNLLYKPVTISCGHTFCKDCLLQALRQKPICPLCRSPTFLQTQTVNENITLRNIIETRYPKFMQKREQELNPKLNNDFLLNDLQRNSSGENEKFENFFTLKVQDANKLFLFPSLTEIVKVSCEIPLDLFNYICQDKKFIVLPENHSVLPLQTYLAECHEILSATQGKMRMEVKILKRVLVEKTLFQMNESEEILKKFNLAKNFGFFVTKGIFIEDNPNFLEGLQTNNQDLKAVETLTEFFKKNLTNLSNVSPNTFVRILHKIGENNIKKLIGAENLKDFQGFSTFSFIIAGSLRAKNEEKRRMFETINIMERLIIAKNIIARFGDITDPLQIFDVDIPTQKMFSLKYSVVLIIVIGIVLYYNRFVQNFY